MVKLRSISMVVTLIWSFAVIQINAQMPGNYIHPDFDFQWALTDTNSAAYGKLGSTWQQAIYSGLGKYDFFASYLSENANETWKFFGFSWNGTGYDVTWTYTQTGMSGSLEANERMITVGDWNGDGKEELILGIDPEEGDLPNLLVFEPDEQGDLPAAPTAQLITPKASRFFNTTPPVTQERFSWSSPPAYIRDIDNDGHNDFVGFSYEGIVTGWYSGEWSNPNAADEVVWTYVDSMLSVGSTLADLDGDGMVELVNASPVNFGPVGPLDLPGSFQRRDYFAISKPNGNGTYTTTRMAWPGDSLRKANGYKLFPFAYGGGGFHAVASYDIDGDGNHEVFVSDWVSQSFWMIEIGSNAVADIDSSAFYKLADFKSLFAAPPDPNFPGSLQVADMNGNGMPEFYSGLGPWNNGGQEAESVVRVEYKGGDPTSASSWEAEIVYQDTVNHLLPRMILAAGDISKNGKQELVIINGNFGAPGAGGRIIVLEAKNSTVTGNYVHPDFDFQWALTDTNSAAYGKLGSTWQQAIYSGLGKYDFFASYLSENANETWKFFGFSWNGTGYDVTWTYTQTGMSGSLEANERMITVGDWNGDGKEELILGIDPEEGDLPNLLVFEPDEQGDLPAAPTAQLITPKASRFFNTTPPVTQERFSWSSPPAYIRDIDNDGHNDFVGFSYEGIVTGWYSGEWSNPNAADEVVWTYVDSMLSVGSTLADLDGDGMVELVNASPVNFGPVGPLDLPGSFQRRDYFAISKPNGNGTYTTTRMAWPGDSLRKANGYKLFPFAYGGGGFHAVASYDIDGDGNHEVFVSDWVSQSFWMIEIGSNAVADIDSSAFYKLADFKSLFAAPPDLNFPGSLQVADMNGNGMPEFYSGLGPWNNGGQEAESVVRVEYKGGDPTSASSWEAEIVYQDTVNHLLPRMILAAGDISKNGKQELVIINGNFGAPGAGGRIIVLEAKAKTVDVEEEKEFLPEKYALTQNYPNPFNPSTRITYYIPKETLVKLDVYNILGQNVAQLVNEMQVAGKYEVTFNANNFASGIYFYQIKADQFIQVKKMILLK